MLRVRHQNVSSLEFERWVPARCHQEEPPTPLQSAKKLSESGQQFRVADATPQSYLVELTWLAASRCVLEWLKQLGSSANRSNPTPAALPAGQCRSAEFPAPPLAPHREFCAHRECREPRPREIARVKDSESEKPPQPFHAGELEILHI